MADLEHGQAIAFFYDGDFRLAMIMSRFREKQDDGATHEIEFVDGGRGPSGEPEERVKLTSGGGLLHPGSGILIAPWAAEGVEYKFRGYHLPPLPEHKQHRCTDRWFFIVFLLAMSFLAWIMLYAFENGRLENLHHAINYEGDICGIDLPEQKYGFWCMAADGEKKLRLKYPICVEECPNSTNTTHLCFDPKSRTNVTIPDYKTRLHRFSPYCWPLDQDLLHQVTTARKEYVKNFSKMLLEIPMNAWMIFPISGFIAFTVGYLYFKLLEKCVDFIVIVFILTTTNLSLVVGCWQLWCFTQHGGDGWMYALGLTSLSAVAFKLFFSGDTQAAVSNAAGCIEAACECINQDFSLLWEPMIALIVRITTVMALCLTLLLLVTCGAPRRLGPDTVRREFEFSTELHIYIGYTVFMLFWLMEMCTSASQYTLAWVTERWYFTPYVNDQKLEWSRNAVCRGYLHLLRKHFLTVAFGSLAILFMRIPRVFFKVMSTIARIALSTRNPLCGCVAQGFCLPCLVLSEKVDHVSKNAYLGVALTSESFFRGAVSAYHTLHSTDEAQSVRWLNGMQGFFQVGGLMLMTAASGAGTLLATHVFNFFGPDIKVRNVVVLLATATGFPIGIGYMTLFDTVGDTILYCWAVQQRRFSYHVKHTRERVEQDESVAGLLSSYFIAPFVEGEDSFAKVNYAPPALRELVLGRQRKLVSFPCSPD